MTFQDLGLAEPILRAVAREGYDAPTPIQARIIPEMLAGRDVVGVAQTGTGKTAAFTLPLLHALAGAQRPRAKTCRALVLVPTRELAAQVEASVRTYGHGTKVTTCVIVGGVKPGPQRRALARGCDVVIATPGRLEDHMRERAVLLDAVQTVVLDEADQMFDLGFAPAMKRILGALPKRRQTALFSATMPAPIRALADTYLTDPAEVTVARQSTPIERIAQHVVHLPKGDKRARLTTILQDGDVESAIVFTRTKRGADRVTRHLKNAGLDAVVIHGDRSQGQRNRALDAFKSGDARVLVATDIAARGIDIEGVSHVVNFELPNVPEAYVHRIGRTARAGASGIAITLCEPEERKLLRDIEKLIGTRIPFEGDAGPVDARSPAASPRARKPADGAGKRKPRKRPANRGRRGKPTGATPASANTPARAEASAATGAARKDRPARPGRRRTSRPGRKSQP